MRLSRTSVPSKASTALAPLLVLLLALALAACDAAGDPTPVQIPDPGAGESAVSPSATASRTAPPATTSPSTGDTAGDTTSAAPTGTPPAEESATEPGEPTSVPTFAGTDSDAPDAGGAPADYAAARARVAALRGGSAIEAARFSTPGDTIQCVLGDDVLGTACELRRGIRDPQVCRNALGDAVGRIELIRAGAVPQCNTDTIREPGARVVRPAALVAGGGVLCAVESIGVTCVDEAREVGFFLAPGRYATFG